MPTFVIRDPEKADQRVAGAMAGIKVTCACGRTFTPYRPYQKYCSRKCGEKYGSSKNRYKKKPFVEKECPICGLKFRSNDGKKKYCCEGCYATAQNNRRSQITERVCPVCGKSFLSSHWLKEYCSGACRAKARKERSQS